MAGSVSVTSGDQDDARDLRPTEEAGPIGTLPFCSSFQTFFVSKMCQGTAEDCLRVFLAYSSSDGDHSNAIHVPAN